MTIVTLPTPTLRPEDRDGYGFARLPANAHDEAPERIDRIPYGRFRNVYLYITERCQLRCEHCYMGERLDRALKMPLDQITATLTTWRQMGGSKLTILGGEPTLHPDYIQVIRHAKRLGYEHMITTSNGLEPAIRKFRRMTPDDFAYVQISLDGRQPGQPRPRTRHRHLRRSRTQRARTGRTRLRHEDHLLGDVRACWQTLIVGGLTGC